ncbi:MAG: PAS domain-containing sensor histidine kinase, partial [Aggregatilineales bacterium]
MPIRAYWLDKTTKQVIIIEMVDHWTWDDYELMRRTELHPCLDSVDTPVRFIYDITETTELPPDTISRIRQVAVSPHDNFNGDLIIIGAKPLFRAVVNVASDLYLRRFKGITVRFVNTLSDARSLDGSDRHQDSAEQTIDRILTFVEKTGTLTIMQRRIITAIMLLVTISLITCATLISAPPPVILMPGIVMLTIIAPFSSKPGAVMAILTLSGVTVLLYGLFPESFSLDFVTTFPFLPFIYGLTWGTSVVFVMLLRRIIGQRDVALMALDELDTMRDELHQREAQYREVMENTTDVAFTADANGYFEYVSDGIRVLTGYKPDELSGKHFVQLIARDYRKIVLEFYITQVESDIKETLFDFPIISKDGREIWVEQRSTLRYQNGRMNGATAILRDITERRLMAQALQSARDEAVKMAEFKSQVLANISHDVRTPLNVISMVVDALQEEFYGEISPEQAEKLHTVSMNIDNVMMLVRNLLDTARLERHVLRLKVSDFTVPKLCRRVEATLKPLAEAKPLRWEATIDADLPDVMYGDMNRLQQVILNLGHNAIQYTDSGCIRLSFICVDDEHWAIRVQDSGAGIPKDAQSYIFDAFWQVDDSFTRKVQEGIGLG